MMHRNFSKMCMLQLPLSGRRLGQAPDSSRQAVPSLRLPTSGDPSGLDTRQDGRHSSSLRRHLTAADGCHGDRLPEQLAGSKTSAHA